MPNKEQKHDLAKSDALRGYSDLNARVLHASALNNKVLKPRLHRFPPLRKQWDVATTEGQQSMPLDTGGYQKQLMEGFQDGVNKGFEEGLIQGKDEGYQEGLRLGYEDGREQGSLEGKSAGKVMFAEAAKPLDAIAAAWQTSIDGYEQRRRTELLQLVEKVTRQVIRCELTLHPTQLLALVEEALAGLPTEPAQLKVFLNTEEFARINDAEPEKVREWGLTADPEMELGECRVVTDTMEMDVGCQHRLEQCIDVLKESLLPEQPDE